MRFQELNANEAHIFMTVPYAPDVPYTPFYQDRLKGSVSSLCFFDNTQEILMVKRFLYFV